MLLTKKDTAKPMILGKLDAEKGQLESGVTNMEGQNKKEKKQNK